MLRLQCFFRFIIQSFLVTCLTSLQMCTAESELAPRPWCKYLTRSSRVLWSTIPRTGKVRVVFLFGFIAVNQLLMPSKCSFISGHPEIGSNIRIKARSSLLYSTSWKRECICSRPTGHFKLSLTKTDAYLISGIRATGKAEIKRKSYVDPVSWGQHPILLEKHQKRRYCRHH